MQKLSLLLKEEKGSSLVIMAISMVFVIGLAALVTDVGMLYVKRTKYMDTCDAAALAGAQELPFSETAAEGVAMDYIARNGEAPEDYTADAADGKLRVTAQGELNYFFAGVLGITSGNTGAAAVAAAEGVTSAFGVAPIGICDQELVKGALYTLKVGEPVLGGGNFGALTLINPGASTYQENFENGCSDEISVGDIILTETGNMSGSTQKAVDFRMGACEHIPQCTCTSYNRDCPRIITIPVYVTYETNGEQIKSIKVVGFAAFLLEGETGSGNESYVRGYFVDQVVPAKSSATQKNYGAYAVKLIE